jgi:hypothetical protein
MKDYKIYVEGNYFILEETDACGFYNKYVSPAKDVKIDPNNLDKDLFRIFNLKDWSYRKLVNGTQVKDKDGKVTSWKDEGEWTKVEKNKAGKDKDSRGRVTNLSDKARRETEKQNKELAEKAVSKSQQKLMGMVHAAKKGEKAASPAVAKIAKGMSKGDAEDFASTKHKGLPDKVKEEDTDTRDTNAEKAGKRVTKDIE